MLAKKEPNKEQQTLKYLANAYKNYNLANWDYARADMQVGTFLVDGCIESPEKFLFITTIIGKGLIDENPDAKVASLLFDKLYKTGFTDGLFKKEIQANFAKILPEKSIERLNDGALMSDCMKSICLAEGFIELKK